MISKEQLLKLIHPRATSRAISTLLDNQDTLLNGLKAITFDGRNGAGACTATGLAVGDKVLAVACLTSGSLGIASSSFEGTVTVIDQIQQTSASDLSTKDYLAILI